MMIDRTCEQCGEHFQVLEWFVRVRGHGKFCSRSCQSRAVALTRYRPSLREMVLKRVEVRAPNDCWIWQGSRDRLGYGYMKFNGRTRKATHYAWEVFLGEPFPEGKIACHKCDNPSCVNPAHLWAGTHLENQRDKVAKGRHPSQRKTHCPAGHPLSGDNLYTHGGTRRCRACDRKHKNERYHRAKVTA